MGRPCPLPPPYPISRFPRARRPSTETPLPEAATPSRLPTFSLPPRSFPRFALTSCHAPTTSSPCPGLSLVSTALTILPTLVSLPPLAFQPPLPAHCVYSLCLPSSLSPAHTHTYALPSRYVMPTPPLLATLLVLSARAGVGGLGERAGFRLASSAHGIHRCARPAPPLDSTRLERDEAVAALGRRRAGALTRRAGARAASPDPAVALERVGVALALALVIVVVTVEAEPADEAVLLVRRRRDARVRVGPERLPGLAGSAAARPARPERRQRRPLERRQRRQQLAARQLQDEAPEARDRVRDVDVSDWASRVWG